MHLIENQREKDKRGERGMISNSMEQGMQESVESKGEGEDIPRSLAIDNFESHIPNTENPQLLNPIA